MRTKPRRMSFENLEMRRCMAASVGWDGQGRGSATLTYYVGTAPSGLAQSTVNSAIDTALKAWSSVANIKFVKTTTPGLNNSIDFTFKRLDGAGGTLAQAYFPKDVNPARIAGDVQFDSSESWEVGNAKGSRAFDLVLVAVHELGHSLGLDHSSVAGSVMAGSVSPSQQFSKLANADISAIRSLYASATSSASSVNTSVASTTTSPTTSTASSNGLSNPTPSDTLNTWARLWQWFQSLQPRSNNLNGTAIRSASTSNGLLSHRCDHSTDTDTGDTDTDTNSETEDGTASETLVFDRLYAAQESFREWDDVITTVARGRRARYA